MCTFECWTLSCSNIMMILRVSHTQSHSHFCQFIASGLHDGEQNPLSEMRLWCLCDFRRRQYGHAAGKFVSHTSKSRWSTESTYQPSKCSKPHVSQQPLIEGQKREKNYHKACLANSFCLGLFFVFSLILMLIQQHTVVTHDMIFLKQMKGQK